MHFKYRFITVICIYRHYPKLKQERLLCTEAGYSRPNETKHERSSKEGFATVFWDAKELLLINYLEDKLVPVIREKKSCFEENSSPALSIAFTKLFIKPSVTCGVNKMTLRG